MRILKIILGAFKEFVEEIDREITAFWASAIEVEKKNKSLTSNPRKAKTKINQNGKKKISIFEIYVTTDDERIQNESKQLFFFGEK